MRKLPDEQGFGWIEYVLIAILVVLILVTGYLLLRPALELMWQNFLESLQ